MISILLIDDQNVPVIDGLPFVFNDDVRITQITTPIGAITHLGIAYNKENKCYEPTQTGEIKQYSIIIVDFTFDVSTLDLLPSNEKNEQGIELIKVITDDPRYYTSLIVFLSGNADSSNYSEANLAGADFILQKSTVSPDLFKTIWESTRAKQKRDHKAVREQMNRLFLASTRQNPLAEISEEIVRRTAIRAYFQEYVLENYSKDLKSADVIATLIIAFEEKVQILPGDLKNAGWGKENRVSIAAISTSLPEHNEKLASFSNMITPEALNKIYYKEVTKEKENKTKIEVTIKDNEQKRKKKNITNEDTSFVLFFNQYSNLRIYWQPMQGGDYNPAALAFRAIVLNNKEDFPQTIDRWKKRQEKENHDNYFFGFEALEIK